MELQRTVWTLHALRFPRQQIQKTAGSTVQDLQSRGIWTASQRQDVHASSSTSTASSSFSHPRRTQSTASPSVERSATASRTKPKSSATAEISRLFQLSKQNKLAPLWQQGSRFTYDDSYPKDVRDLVNAMAPQNARQEQTATRERPGASTPTRQEIIAANNPAPTVFEPPPPAHVENQSLRLGPVVGRTIIVNPSRNVDLGRAFSKLTLQIKNNNVRRDFMKQRFYERPGMKRKRLRMERWRTRFKEQFRLTVTMVQKMKRQGW